MAKRFVVATSELESSQAKAFKDFLAPNGVGWWHWLPNFWLVKDTRDEANALTAVTIRDEVKRLAPEASCLVMEIHEDITWSSTGRSNPDGKKFADWLKQTWPN